MGVSVGDGGVGVPVDDGNTGQGLTASGTRLLKLYARVSSLSTE